MIDYQKSKVFGVDPNFWLNHKDLNFKREINTKTGELSTKEVAIHYGLRFIIFYRLDRPDAISSMWIHGSLHKYCNFLNNVHAPNQWNDHLKTKGYNGNSFSLYDFLDVLYDLEKRFNVRFDNSTLHHLEYGLNVKHDLSTKLLLDGLIMHKGTLFNPERSNYKFLQRAKKTQFEIKAYNKQLQYGELFKVLRFEKKVNKMEHIKQFKISSLNDLRLKCKWDVLYKDLQKCWEDILFIDLMMNTKDLNTEEQTAFKDFSNLTYWGNLSANRRDVPKKVYKTLEIKCKGLAKETFKGCLQTSYEKLTKVNIDNSNMKLNLTQHRILFIHFGLVG